MSKKDFSKEADAALTSLPVRDFNFAEPGKRNNRMGERAGTQRMGNARIIEISRIQPDPDQPRKLFNEEDLAGLAQSIRECGILQPISVTYIEDKDFYQIISGERRWRAAQLANLNIMPCIIHNDEEGQGEKRLIKQLIENLQRSDIHPVEECQGILNLIEQYNLTHQQVADRLGKSRSAITNILRLRNLPENIKKDATEHPDISKDILMQLLTLNTVDDMNEIWKKVVKEKLTVRQTRKFLKERKKTKNKKHTFRYDDPNGVFTVKIEFDTEDEVSYNTVEKALIEVFDHIKDKSLAKAS